MNASIDLADIRITTCQKLEDLSQIIGDPTLSAETRCMLFNEEAEELLHLLQTFFTFTGMASRKAEDLEDVAAIWKSFENLSDKVMEVLTRLHAENPGCVSDYYYNKVLDYRNAARSRCLIHS